MKIIIFPILMMLTSLTCFGQTQSTQSSIDLPILLLILVLVTAFIFFYSRVLENMKREKADEEKVKEKEELYNLLTENKIISEDAKSQIKNPNISVENFRDTVKYILKKLYLTKKYGEELGEKLTEEQFFLGMTEEQLIDSKGEPTKIETEVFKNKTKKIYIYGNKNSGDVFNFVDGKLERFKDR